MKKGQEQKFTSKIVSTTVTKGSKKGEFVLTTITEQCETIDNVKELKAIVGVYEDAIKVMEKRNTGLQGAINKLSTDPEMSDALSAVIAEFDSQRTELAKGKADYERIKEILESINNIK